MSVFSRISLIVLLFCSVALIAAPKRSSRKSFDRDKKPPQRESFGDRAILTCPGCNKRLFVSIASDQGGGREPVSGSGHDRQPPPRPPEADGERGIGPERNRVGLTCPSCHKSLIINVVPDRGGQRDGRGGPRGPARRN